MIYLFLVLVWFPDVTQPLPVTAGFTVYTDRVRLKNILSLDIFQLQERFANGKETIFYRPTWHSSTYKQHKAGVMHINDEHQVSL